ncbi:MAG: protein-L-isoaspartate(D-aspartate) O-methyltransferase [Planctomycetota bacterium]
MKCACQLICLLCITGAAVGAEPATQEAPAWPHPRFAERENERLRMVASQIESRDVSDEKVLEAMRAVPRHLFVPAREQRSAYGDHPLPIGYGQTISQPYIVAFMTKFLNLTAEKKALEIGTGSGYQAAVLSELTPHVFTIEIVPELAETARKRLADLGYSSIHTSIADGYNGWLEEAPFDAIIVTAAATHVPPPLLRQLAPGGVIIIPVGGVYSAQNLIVVTKNEDGTLGPMRSVLPVRFVPLLGSGLRPRD